MAARISSRGKGLGDDAVDESFAVVARSALGREGGHQQVAPLRMVAACLERARNAVAAGHHDVGQQQLEGAAGQRV
jgi:hypothetical protein